MAQVANEAGLTRAGARRVLLTLKELGYVATDGRFFFLTSRVLELAQGFLDQTLWDQVRPLIQQLADTLNETASAGVLEGFDVVYTIRARALRPIHLDLAVGAHLPAHISSMGRVLLAALDQGDLTKYLRQATFEQYTPHTVTDPNVLRERLEETRLQGWSMVSDESVEGVSGVSVPLLDGSGVTIAALNVSMATQRATAKNIQSTILPRLREVSSSITASMKPR